MTDPEDVNATTGLWKAVEPLLIMPVGAQVRLLSPATAKKLLVEVDVAQFLLLAREGVDSAAGTSLGWSPGKCESVVKRLADYGYLLPADQPAELVAQSPWLSWGPFAWAYHETALHPTATNACGEPAALDLEQRPSSFRSIGDGPILLLPRLAPRSRMSFTEVLEQRRTHRHYLEESVALEDFAEILRYTFGPLRFADGGRYGITHLRAAASGGARHETEAYVYVFDVQDIAAGLYAYDSLRHGLVPVRVGELREEFDHLTLDQGFFGRAAFGVLTVAVTDRMSWKYPHPSAYRILWQNAGHMAQVFSMVCTALDLGASLTGAIRAAEARAGLGLESDSEIVTFALACGRPLLRDGGLPESIRTPRAAFEI